jgi:hypothetical protein
MNQYQKSGRYILCVCRYISVLIPISCLSCITGNWPDTELTSPEMDTGCPHRQNGNMPRVQEPAQNMYGVIPAVLTIMHGIGLR